MSVQRILLRVLQSKDGELRYQWQVIGFQAEHREWKKLAQFTDFISEQNMEYSQVLLVTPAQWSSHHALEMTKQQRKHFRTAGVYLIEESLADDVADVHYAWSEHHPITLVSTIGKQRLQALIEQWDDVPINLVGIVSEIQLLPDRINHLWAHSTGWVYRGHAQTDLMCGEPGEWLAFESMVHDEHLDATVFGSFPVATESNRKNVFQQSWLRYLVEQWARLKYSTQLGNWCWGEFSVKRQKNTSHFKWQPMALAASVALVAFLGHRVGLGIYFNAKANNYRQQTSDLFQEMFPGAREPKLLRREVEGRMSQRADNQGGFWPVFALTSEEVNAQREESGPTAIVIQRFTYDAKRKQLRLDLEASSVSMVEDFQQNMSQKGLNAQTGRLNQEGERVNARVTVEG